jgi:translation elongation factor EF-4
LAVGVSWYAQTKILASYETDREGKKTGTLHASVFEDRLRQEHGGSLIITAPTVPYMIRGKDGKEAIISNPSEFPSGDHDLKQIERLEPYVLATITMPEEYLGKVIELCEVLRKPVQLLRLRTNIKKLLE